MWFKNLKIFRLSSDWQISADELAAKLEAQAFVPGSSSREANIGWVPPRDNSSLVYAVSNTLYFLTLKAEKKLLPTTVINQFAREKALEVEEQQGYKPGRKQMKEIKELVTDELLPKAFSIYRETRVCLDLQYHWLHIEAGSAAKADEVIGLLVKSLDPMPIQSCITHQSPAKLMTEALFSGLAPTGFAIDPHCELKSTQQDRATIRFANITPEQSEIGRYVEEGKVCSKLGMTWNDKISFVLNEALELKRIAPLDVMDQEESSFHADADEQFDADMTLMAGSLAQLLDDLIDALGGIKSQESP